MTHYRSGTEFERDVRRLLEDAGYWTMRSAGSKGKVDVIALKPGQVLAVQCKRTGGISSSEWNEVYRLARRLTVTGMEVLPVLAEHKTRPSRIELVLMAGERTPGSRHMPGVEFVLDEVAEVTG